MSLPAFELEDLRYRYPDGRVALDGLTMSIAQGDRVALLGSNGSGKTTLLLNMLGLLESTSGALRAFGEQVTQRPRDLRRLRSRVGMVFQNPDSQLLSASVAEDVSFGPMNLGLDAEEVRGRVEAALTAVGMAEYSDVPVHAMSFGQKKRVCIAGVLAMRPEALLLDEPTAGLDAPSCEDLFAVLDSLHAGGMTIVMATHDIDLAYAWADVAHVLESGKLVTSCRSDWFHEAFPRFAEHGLAPPRVADVYQVAREADLLGAEGKPPRTHAELLEALAREGESRERPEGGKAG